MSEVFQIPLRLGLTEGTDPKNVPPGTVLVAENVRQPKVGRLGKRWGSSVLVRTILGGGSIAAGARLLTYGDGVSIVDERDAYSYVSQIASWKRIAPVPDFKVTNRPLIDTPRSATAVTSGVYNDFVVTAYVAGATVDGPIYTRVDSIASGQCVMPPTIVTVAGTGSYPKVLIIGSKAHIAWTTSAGAWATRELDLTTFTWQAAAARTAGLIANSPFAAQVVGTDVYVCYRLAAGANRIQVDRWSSAFASLATTAINGATASVGLAIHATSGEFCYVAIGGSAAPARLAVLNASTLATVTAPTAIGASSCADVAVTRYDASNCVLFRQLLSGSVVTEKVSSGVVVDATSQRATQWAHLLSEPWWYDGRLYAALTASTTTEQQHSHVIVEVETSTNSGTNNIPHRHVATFESRTAASNFTASPGNLTQAATSGTNVYLAVPFLASQRAATQAVATGARLVTIAVPSVTDDTWRPALAGPNLVLSCGAPAVFDGVSAFPAGFVAEPAITAAAAGGAGTGSMADGTYQYVAVYEWRDANGILHRSAPSVVVSATVATSGANTGSVSLTITCTSLSCKQNIETGFGSTSASPVIIAIYRTRVGDTTFHRLTHEPDANVVFNDPLNATVAFTDTRNDSNITGVGSGQTLISRPQLYTAGGVLDAIAPNCSLTSLVVAGRVYLLLGDGRTVAASKDVREDPTVAPEFNEGLTLYFDDDKTALGALFETPVVFGEASIDLVEGDAPNAAGLMGGWRVRRLQTDVGCTQPRSVVSFPGGLLFRSARGFELLGGDFAVQYIGAAVEDTLASYPNVTSGVLVADENEVRFTCLNTAGTAGVVIVFDYLAKAWYVRKYYDTDAATETAPFVDAALIDGTWTALSASGRVYQEDKTDALDTTRFVKMRVKVRVSYGPNGWLRMKRMQINGTSRTNHKLTMSIFRDYAAAAEQTETFEAGTPATTVGVLEKARVTLARQKGHAFDLQIEDAQPTDTVTYPISTGEGLQLEGIACQMQVKRGLPKASAERSA